MNIRIIRPRVDGNMFVAFVLKLVPGASFAMFMRTLNIEPWKVLGLMGKMGIA